MMHYVKLTRAHHRASFDCGVDSLNHFLKIVAREEADRNLGVTYVATPDGITIAGYYTLASYSVQGELFPSGSKLSSTRAIPAILLGKLAIATTLQGQGFGNQLLFQALYDCQRVADIAGSHAVVVDALESAVRFYKKYGFQPLTDNESHLFLTLKTIRQMHLQPQQSLP